MTVLLKKSRVIIFESTRPENPTTGGSYISLKVIIEGLVDAGWDVVVVSYFKNPLLQFSDIDSVRNHIIPHYSLRRLLGKKVSNTATSQNKSTKISLKRKLLNAMTAFTSSFFVHFFMIFNAFTLAKTIARLGPDLVYCNTGLVNDRAIIMASVLSKKKIICHLRNLSKLGFIDRYLSQRITGAIFISRTVADYYLSNSVFFKKHLVIHNALGSNFEEQDYVQGSNILATEDKYQIAGFMRLIPWKGALTLLRAFSEFHRKGGRGILSIYGDGPLKANLMNEVLTLNLEEYVVFHGHVNDVVNQMKKSSLIVAPSDEPEPLGRTVMEAKRLGIPVIASNAGGFLETINHGYDGMLFDIGSVESLSERMLDVYRNKELRVNLSLNGLEQSKAWSSKAYCNKLLEFVDEVCF